MSGTASGNWRDHPVTPGVVLLLAAVLAMLAENSPLHVFYDRLLDLKFEIRLGDLALAKPLLHWINDGLMAIFFFVVGLEIKKELIEGQLNSVRKVALPLIAALGGMALPALIYCGFNFNDPVARAGWAIPSATDIAFTLGVLALLGSRVPASLKIFVMAVAVLDDMGAIILIALFYTANLSVTMLVWAAAFIGLLVILNRCKVMSLVAYALVGACLWLCVLKSGVHATLAGVVTALFVPLRRPHGETGYGPAEIAEHALKPWVNFGILPVFAFANAGVSLAGLSLAAFTQPVPLGIACGLVLGKAVGIFGITMLAIKFGVAPLPQGARPAQLFGVSILCGIGFTMSLFIGSLAFEEASDAYMTQVRFGVLSGSMVAACAGYLWLSQLAARGMRA